MHGALKVLFVEDRNDDVALAVRALERDGLRFDWRRVDSEDALRAALSDFGPDVVLCDYRIPGYCGIAALDLVQTLQPFTPVLLVSGFIGESAALEYLKKGAVDCLLKSHLRRLGPAVRRALADAENRARAAEAEQWQRRMVEVLEATSDLVVVSDLDGRITFVNEAGCQLLGESPQQLIGADWNARICRRSSEKFRSEIMSCAMQKGRWRGEIPITTGDGTEIITSQVVTAHRDDRGEMRCFSAVAHDLSDRKSFEAQIHKLSHYDNLTGLPNLAHMAAAFEDAMGEGRSRLLAIAIINLDDFRLVDEGLGRSCSDILLQQISATLKSAVGPQDAVARLGPDEFMIVLGAIKDRAAAGRLVKDVLAAIGAPRKLGGQDVQFTASGGVALSPHDGEDFQSLHNSASAAMHESKMRGPGQWRFHSRGSERRAQQRLRLETGLRGAIQNCELTLAYQTQYNIQDGSACGVEALARWRRADGEVVAPAVFVPLAEHMNLINSLGAWVMQEACSTVAGWDRAAECDSVVCVNVSTQQLGADLYTLICRVLESTGFTPARLELEITESVLMADGQRVLAQLARLRRLGVS
jgi:diguanylate cyclase (GGDEF)-like protein/PAS domain S-box-containing protein